MRRILLNLSLLAVVAAPLAAHAASTDLLTLTNLGTSGVYTFLVPSVPTVAGAFADSDPSPFAGSFYLNIVPTSSPTKDPCVGSTCDPLYFFDTANGGGIDDEQFGLVLQGNQFFSGTLQSPTLLLGSGTLTQATGGPNFSYSITAVTPPSTTPEPSSLVLLGTGAVGLLGAFRRRLLA